MNFPTYLTAGTERRYNEAKEISYLIRQNPAQAKNFESVFIRMLTSAKHVFVFSVIINRAYDVFAEIPGGSSRFIANHEFQRVANSKIIFFYKRLRAASNNFQKLRNDYLKKRTLPMSRPAADALFKNYKINVQKHVYNLVGYNLYGPYKNSITTLWNNLRLVKGPASSQAAALCKELHILITNVRSAMV